MNKQQKFTQSYFNEADPTVEITTQNTDLKKNGCGGLRRSSRSYAGSRKSTVPA